MPDDFANMPFFDLGVGFAMGAFRETAIGFSVVLDPIVMEFLFDFMAVGAMLQHLEYLA